MKNKSIAVDILEEYASSYSRADIDRLATRLDEREKAVVKETAEKIFKMLYRRIDCYDEPCSYKLREELRIGKDYFQELAKQFGVDLKELKDD